MGRAKKKPEYDQNRIMEQFQNCIVEAYTSGIADGTGISLRQVSEEFGITLMKTRKILISKRLNRSRWRVVLFSSTGRKCDERLTHNKWEKVLF